MMKLKTIANNTPRETVLTYVLKAASMVGGPSNISQHAHSGQIKVSDFCYLLMVNPNIYQDQLVKPWNKMQIVAFSGFYQQCLQSLGLTHEFC